MATVDQLDQSAVTIADFRTESTISIPDFASGESWRLFLDFGADSIASTL